MKRRYLELLLIIEDANNLKNAILIDSLYSGMRNSEFLIVHTFIYHRVVVIAWELIGLYFIYDPFWDFIIVDNQKYG